MPRISKVKVTNLETSAVFMTSHHDEHKYMRGSLSALVFMINLFWFDLVYLFKVAICVFTFQKLVSLVHTKSGDER